MKGNVTISKMTGKLAGIDAINTDPLSNAFCLDRKFGVCEKCYSKLALNSYRKGARNAFMRNGLILSSGIIPHIPFIETEYARFNAHGELLNYWHFYNYCNIAMNNPQTTFTLWSKRPELVETWLAPRNLRLVYSHPDIIESAEEIQPPPAGFHIWYAATRNKDLVNCSGPCLECLRCWKDDGASIVTLLR